MVSKKSYHQHTKNYWRTVKVKVKTNTVLRNGMIEIPAGTVCQIIDKSGGFTLKTDPCKTCGVSIFIRKVPPEQVVLFWQSKT